MEEFFKPSQFTKYQPRNQQQNLLKKERKKLAMQARSALKWESSERKQERAAAQQRFRLNNVEPSAGPSMVPNTSMSFVPSYRLHKTPSYVPFRKTRLGQRMAKQEKKARRLTKRLATKPLAAIQLSDAKKKHILDLLASNAQQEPQQSGDSISNKFQREYKQIIEGSIDDKLSRSFTLSRIPHLDFDLFSEQKDKEIHSESYCNMMSYRKTLPAYDKRDEILHLIRGNQVIVISGETGCGKTTQVTQFILDDYIERSEGSICKVLCSQPRRICAIAVAERVAQERAERLGHSCGFKIRMESL